MVQITTGIRPEEVRAGGEHVLFVEGKEDDSLDRAVLRALLKQTLRVEAMGPAFSIMSAAQALAHHHPRYYFLIDRDHHDDEFVEQSWQNFPDPETYNLLVWRRREIENYFLDPPFLVESKYCHAAETDLTSKLLEFAQERLFLDATNSVILAVREEQKRTWIDLFSNPDEFRSKDEAISRLTSEPAFEDRSRHISSTVSREQLADRFDSVLTTMTGGGEQLAYGSGRWIEMISGKKVLRQLVNSGGFTVEDDSGEQLTGKEREREIVRELAIKDVDSRPADLEELQKLIQNRVGAV